MLSPVDDIIVYKVYHFYLIQGDCVLSASLCEQLHKKTTDGISMATFDWRFMFDNKDSIKFGSQPDLGIFNGHFTTAG